MRDEAAARAGSGWQWVEICVLQAGRKQYNRGVSRPADHSTERSQIMRRLMIVLFLCCLEVPAGLSAETADDYLGRGMTLAK